MKIRKCKKSDIQELFKLDRLLEEHPWNRRSKENWIWKYFGKNPAGKSIFYIALQNSKILASFAAIPIHYNLSGKKILASHSISMMVHPKWQNRGLIKYVVEKVLEQLKKKNYPSFMVIQIIELTIYIKINLDMKTFLSKLLMV